MGNLASKFFSLDFEVQEVKSVIKASSNQSLLRPNKFSGFNVDLARTRSDPKIFFRLELTMLIAKWSCRYVTLVLRDENASSLRSAYQPLHDDEI